MKKILPIILIIISLLLFGSLVYITIYAKELPEIIATIGFIVIGYISVVLFAVGWFKIKKS